MLSDKSSNLPGIHRAHPITIRAKSHPIAARHLRYRPGGLPKGVDNHYESPAAEAGAYKVVQRTTQ